MKLKIISESPSESQFYLVDENDNYLDTHFSTSQDWAETDLFSKLDQEKYKKLYGEEIELTGCKLGDTSKYKTLFEKQISDYGCQQEYSDFAEEKLLKV